MKKFKEIGKLPTEKEQKIKELLSTKVLSQITDKSIEIIIRQIIFNHHSIINWDRVEYLILSNMPELTIEN